VDLKNDLRAIRESLSGPGFSRAERQSIERDLDRIEQAVASPRELPEARGLAIFACQPRKLYLQIPLPQVHRSRVVLDRSPRVRELKVVTEEFGRVLAVAIDRARARLFEVTALGARELSCIEPHSTRGGKFHSDREGSPGWGEHDYHNRIQREKLRHYQSVAHGMLAAHRDRAFRGLVIGGPGQEPEALARFLDRSLTDLLLGTVRLNPTALTQTQVYAATIGVRADALRAGERRGVSELLEAAGTGWAVNGLRESLEALFRGQARALLVRGDVEIPGFRCAHTGRLVRQAGECQKGDSVVPVPDLLDDVIEEALAQRIPVSVLRDPEAAAGIKDVAATLRFR
jgi:peptide subunit release factor 1 (eRF1)